MKVQYHPTTLYKPPAKQLPAFGLSLRVNPLSDDKLQQISTWLSVWWQTQLIKAGTVLPYEHKEKINQAFSHAVRTSYNKGDMALDYTVKKGEPDNALQQVIREASLPPELEIVWPQDAKQNNASVRDGLSLGPEWPVW